MNRYGVDDDYFRKKLESVIASLYNYTPEELSRELQRLANTASKANQPSQPVPIGYIDRADLERLLNYKATIWPSTNEIDAVAVYAQPVAAQPEAIIKLQDALILMLDRFDRPNNLFSQRMACSKARLALSNTESK